MTLLKALFAVLLFAVLARSGYAYTPTNALNNTQLQGMATITYPGGVTRDTFGNGNGATPLFYMPSNSACSLNSGNGDGGSQVKSADGKCWIAQFPAGGADARQWGILFDGATDNTTTLQAALNWAAQGNSLILPPGVANHASALSVTMTLLTARMVVVGAGPDLSVLGFTGSSGNGITVTEANNTAARNSFDFHGFTYCTNKVGLAQGMQFIQNANIGTGNLPINRFGITLRGCDGFAQADYWTLGAGFTGIYGIDFTGLFVQGPSAPGTLGAGVSIANGGSAIVAAFNFPGVVFNNLLTGITGGANVQGLTVTGGSNFTTVGNAITITPATGVDEIIVANSQFNCVGICLWLASADILVHDNYFILEATNIIGVYIPSTNSATVRGNSFRNGSSFTGQIALRTDNAPTGTAGINVIGNNAVGLAVSLNIAAGVAVPINASGNVWGGATPILAAGATTNFDQKLPFVNVIAPANAIQPTQIFNDSNTVVWGATIAGGGANVVLGYSDGVNWTVVGK